MRPFVHTIGRFCLLSLAVLLVSFSLFSSTQPVYAAPFILNFVTETNAQYSNLGKINVSVEVIDQATGNRVSTSGTPVTLRLIRCPGSPCSPFVVNASYATANTISGLATFSNLTVPALNDDYYFGAVATGITGDTTFEFDVVQAYAVFSNNVLPSPLSIASRFSSTVQIRMGSASGAIDTTVNSSAAIDLIQCIPSGGGGCTPSLITNNFATGTFILGAITFNNLNIPTIGPNFYLLTDVAGAVNATTFERDVAGAYIDLTPQPTDQFVGVAFAQSGFIRIQGSNVVDTLADGVPVTLDLARCVSSGGGGCTPTLITSGFGSTTATDGAFTFSGLSIATPNTNYYFIGRGPTGSGVTLGTTLEFDVFTTNYVDAYITFQGRASGPVTVPIRLILKPTSGGAFRDVTVTAVDVGGTPLRGRARVNNLIPGTYTLWVKYDRSLARITGSFVVDTGGLGIAIPELLTGDANNDNLVTILDFTILAATFGKASTEPGYDARADFNGDGLVTILDFTLLAANFGTAGAPQPTP